MMDRVADFIEWWTSLTATERRQRVAEANDRRAAWRHRRALTLFGLLEDDAAFGILEKGHLAHFPDEESTG